MYSGPVRSGCIKVNSNRIQTILKNILKIFLLYYRKERKEGMPEIFKKWIYEGKKTHKQTNLR